MSGQDRPTLPGFRDVFGDPRDHRRLRSPPPADQQSQPQYAPLHGMTAPPPQAGRGYAAPVDPAYYARQAQMYAQGPPARSYSLPAPPHPSQYPGAAHTAYPRPAPPAAAPGPAGGHFSILRTSHGPTPLAVASSSPTYAGLSGNVRPLRPSEYSQYAVDMQTAGGSDVKYQCPHCGKGFDRPSSLRTHMNSHTGARPYTCSYPGCGRQFGVLSNMYRHVRSSHGQGGSGGPSTNTAGDDEDDESDGA